MAAITWKLNPEYVIDPAIEQVENKMEFLEQTASRFLSSTQQSLDEMSKSVQFDDIGDDLNSIDSNIANIEAPEPLEVSSEIPPSGLDDSLDVPETQFIAVPEAPMVPKMDFALQAPIIPDLSTLIPPELIAPAPITFDDVAVPNAPAQIEVPLLDDTGVGEISPVSGVQLPEVNFDVEMPTLAGDVPEIEPTFLNVPELESFVDSQMPQAPQAGQLQRNDVTLDFDVSKLTGIDVGDFNINEPTLRDFQDVTAPQISGEYQLPQRPDIDFQVDNVEAPIIVFDDLPPLLEIDLPTFDYQPLEDFDGEAPDINSVEDALNTYKTELSTAVEDLMNRADAGFEDQFKEETKVFKDQYNKLAKWVSGEEPAWHRAYQVIEETLRAKARDGEDRQTLKAVREVVDEWAARGFSQPQGALDKRVDTIREEGRFRTAEANRAITADTYNKQLEEVKYLIAKGLELEENLYKRYVDKRDYELQVFKYRMEAYWNVYNAVNALFTAQNEAFKVYFDVYRLKLEKQFKDIEVYRERINAQRALLEVNDQSIRVYNTKLQALNTRVDLYKSQLQAVVQKSEVFKSQIDLYRAELQGASEEINVDKLRLEMFQTQLDAEKTKFGVNELLLKNYTDRVNAYATRKEVEIKNQESNIAVARLHLEKYQADLTHEKAHIDYQLAEAQNATSNFMRNVEMYKLNVEKDMNRIDYTVKVADIMGRTNISNLELAGRYADINSRIRMGNLDTQTKIIDAKSKIALANLDAKTRHMEAEAKIKMDNLDAEVKVKEANSRIKLANADTVGKNADIKARVAISNADLLSKHYDMLSRTGVANMDAQSRVLIANADLQGRYAEINSRNLATSAETQMKYSDLQLRYGVANMDNQFKQTELASRITLSNLEAQIKSIEANTRIATSKADLKSRFADMRSRTNIANMEMRTKHIDMVARTQMAQLDSDTRVAETNARLAMARADLVMKKYEFSMTKGLERNKLAVEVAKAMGTINAQLAAGAMSAIHVSAGISASSSLSMSNSTSQSDSESHSYSY